MIKTLINEEMRASMVWLLQHLNIFIIGLALIIDVDIWYKYYMIKRMIKN